MKNILIIILFMGSHIPAGLAQDYATKSEHERARRLAVPSFTEQITELIEQDYEQFKVEWSSNSKGFTSRAIFLSKSLEVEQEGKLEEVEVELRILNPQPMNDWFGRRWIREQFLRSVVFLGPHKKLKFTPKQARTIVRALEEEFENLERTILEAREDYRPIVN